MVEHQVDVHVQLGGADVRAGRLYVHRRRNQESASFSYVDGYLQRDDAYALDPALPLTSGSFHTAPGYPLFGAFAALM